LEGAQRCWQQDKNLLAEENPGIDYSIIVDGVLLNEKEKNYSKVRNRLHSRLLMILFLTHILCVSNLLWLAEFQTSALADLPGCT